MFRRNQRQKAHNAHVIDAPSVRDVQEFFDLRGCSSVEAWQFHHYYDLRQWKNSKGQPISSWKLAAVRWIKMIGERYPQLIRPQNKTDQPPAKPPLEIQKPGLQVFVITLAETKSFRLSIEYLEGEK